MIDTVVFLGKRTSRESPKVKWPGCHLAGTTHSNQRWAPKYGTIENWDSWWDLHPFGAVPGYQGIKKRRPKTYQWYQTLPGPNQPGYRPLWLTELDPTIPAGVLFPTQRILDAFGKDHCRWIISQTDAMVAFYILEGVKRIVLSGHGTRFDAPHMIDHCGMLVWMTIARERGIEVVIVQPSWYVGVPQPYGISTSGWKALRPGKVA